MAKYKDIMDRIELTDEMRERVLKNVKEQAASDNAKSETEEMTDPSASTVIKCVSSKKTKRTVLLRSLALACTALLVATGVFISWKASEKVKNGRSGSVETDNTESASYPSGVIAGGESTVYFSGNKVDSIEGINEAFGLQLSDLTTLPFTPSERSYVDYRGFSAEIVYSRGVEDECIWTIDVSGLNMAAIAENYDSSESCAIYKGRQAVLCGSEEGYSYIFWSDGYRYHSVQLLNPTDKETMMKIAAEIESML